MDDNVENLVQRAQYGHMEAFDRIVELFQDAVFGAACASVQNFHEESATRIQKNIAGEVDKNGC